MGIIKNHKNFERKTTQDNPTNLNPKLNENKEFDLNTKTIKKKKNVD